jgi:hypothetical protein
MNRRDFFGRLAAGGAATALGGAERVVPLAQVAPMVESGAVVMPDIDAILRELPRAFANNRAGLREAIRQVVERKG